MLNPNQNSNSLVSEILDRYESILGRKLFVSYSGRRRLEDFIKILKANGLDDRAIINLYDYVLNFYKNKKYKVTLGHLCSKNIFKFMSKIRNVISIKEFDLLYHKLYSKAVPSVSPPYDSKLDFYKKLSENVLGCSSLIYVPSMGFMLERGYYVSLVINKETSLGKSVLDLTRQAYEFYLSLRSEYSHRDYIPAWRKQPFWKSLIHRIYFNTPIGPLKYYEVLFLLEYKDKLLEALPPKERYLVDLLETKVKDFEYKYNDYLWLLPKADPDIVSYIADYLRI